MLNKKLVISRVLCLILIAVLLSGYAYASGPKTVTISDNGKTTSVTSEAKNIADLLSEQKISLNKGDVVNPKESTGLKDNMTIKIDRIKNVIISQTGELFSTTEELNAEFLKNHGIEIGKEDYISVSFNSEKNIYEISVVKVETTEITEDEALDNGTIEIESDALYKGQKKVETAGNKGKVSKKYQVRYENGTEVSRVLVSETVIEKPVDSVVYVGTKEKPASKASVGSAEKAYTSGDGILTTASGKVLSYSKVIRVNATAYDLSYESCGKNPGDRGYGVTASGMRAQYGVVAVDTRLIPLGTKLYIEGVDGSWVYGEAVAADTGGAIKGNRVDLFYNSRQSALGFGRRAAMVYVLTE